MLDIPEGKVILDFFASWCMPCKIIAPMLDEINEETDITVIKIDVEEFQETVAEFGIQSMPTLKFYEDGKEINTMIGAGSKDKILSMFGEDK